MEVRLFVLVDSGTASAAEIFAAALQDNGRATLVGPDARTFGKGRIQNIQELVDGSAVAVTKARGTRSAAGAYRESGLCLWFSFTAGFWFTLPCRISISGFCSGIAFMMFQSALYHISPTASRAVGIAACRATLDSPSWISAPG